eukprot:Skav235707  [mRNA]  locus=scaffold280:388879:389337:- [translate_table: standard]
MDLLRGLFVSCCACNDVPEPELQGTVQLQKAFKSYKSKSRTELAEDVIEPRLNLNGWTVRNGQKIVMMEIEKETTGIGGIGVALEAAKGGQGLVITRLEANGLVAEWNLDRPLRAVNVGDVIVEVNKKRGTSKELSKQIQKEKQLQLLVECS